MFENSNWLVDRLKWLEKKTWKNRPIRIITIFVLVCLMVTCVIPMAKAGPPGLVIKGVITDSESGQPIAGGRVFDDGYAHEPDWVNIQPDKRSKWGAITNAKGEYSFLTWPEHHCIKVIASGYKAQRRSLYSGHLTLNIKDEEVFDFALEPKQGRGPRTTVPLEPESVVVMPTIEPEVSGPRKTEHSDEKVWKETIAGKLQNLMKRREHVQSELNFAEISLDEIREASGFTDLAERDHPHTITLRLNELELEQSRLLLQIAQAEATVKELEDKAANPAAAQIEDQVQGDPVMLALAQELVRRELEREDKLKRFDENDDQVRKLQETLNKIKGKMQTRKTELAEQIFKSKRRNAVNSLVVLRERLRTLERLREETAARKKELDLARVRYEQRLAVRDERRRTLDSLLAQIERLKIIHDDPVPAQVHEPEREVEKTQQQRLLRTGDIERKLRVLSERLMRVQRELHAAEQALDDVRARWGISDLEERSYRHPITSRLVRLELERDNCSVEIAQQRAKTANIEKLTEGPEGKVNLKKAQDDLIVLQSKLEELQRMCAEAKAKKKDLDSARVQYKQRSAIRDERKKVIDSMRAEIEKWKMKYAEAERSEAESQSR